MVSVSVSDIHVRVRVRDVQAAAADVLGLPLAAMTAPGRARSWAQGRQIAMAVAVEITGQSLPFIGRCFRRDHTTVLHAFEVVTERAARSPDVAEAVSQVAAVARRRAVEWQTAMRAAFSKEGNQMSQNKDRPCATCAHAIVFGAVTCALFRDPETQRPRLATAMRLDGGGCGPRAAFYEPCPKVPATVLPFPQAHRVSS